MGMNRRAVLSIVLLIIALSAACHDPEKQARYVKEPFTATRQQDVHSLDDAYQDARTRLASIDDAALRQELARDLDQEYQRRLAGIHEAEEQRRLAEAEQAAREREAEQARQAQAEAERQRQLAAQKEETDRAAAVELQKQARQCIIDLEATMRRSDWIEGTKVLVLRNTCTLPVTFDLRCFTCGDTAYKTLFVTVPARGEGEIGFLEGWTGNFTGGERCEAHFGGERLWNRHVPGTCG